MYQILEEHPVQTVTSHASAEFEARFLRCQDLLHFIAGRVLGDRASATEAVLNCWRAASSQPSRFVYEGDFRSWLLRILIDESVAIRETRSQPASAKPSLNKSGLTRPFAAMAFSSPTRR